MRFELKEEHLTLLRYLEIDKDKDFYDLPKVDTKRPYGNSMGGSICEDVRRLLNQHSLKNSECMKYLEELHTALDIILTRRSFDLDIYTKVWKKTRQGRTYYWFKQEEFNNERLEFR
ncbi:MAG: hypothetical protein CL489_10465 [Acidobacteria bacterium]|nr:hypothetical protein [Acidobacteriota bacterium]